MSSILLPRISVEEEEEEVRAAAVVIPLSCLTDLVVRVLQLGRGWIVVVVVARCVHRRAAGDEQAATWREEASRTVETRAEHAIVTRPRRSPVAVRRGSPAYVRGRYQSRLLRVLISFLPD